MNAILKIVTSIDLYYQLEFLLNKLPDISCCKPGNPDFDVIWRNPGLQAQDSVEYQDYMARYIVKIDQHLANCDISPEIFPEDRFEINKENNTFTVYVRWENKTALEEHVKRRWGQDSDVSDPLVIISYEIIDLS
jgi:hypothetical protein